MDKGYGFGDQGAKLRVEGVRCRVEGLGRGLWGEARNEGYRGFRVHFLVFSI